ncbi:MAG: tetratricopeptide repeat protein [Myxococcota bacterium]
MSRRWLACFLAFGSCAHAEIHPDAVVHHDQAVEHLAAGRCEQAEERCRLALEYGRHFAHPHNCLGLVDLECRFDLDDAARHFKDALTRDADFAEAANNLGITFFRREPADYEQARRLFEQALEIDPRYADARANLGLCALRQGFLAQSSGREDRARRHFAESRSQLMRLRELAPERADVHHHLGFVALQEGRLDEAEGHFDDCLARAPDDALCTYNRGTLMLRLGRCPDAIAALLSVLAQPDGMELEVSARHNLGLAYEQCTEHEQGALRDSLAAVRRDPAAPETHVSLGQAYLSLGQRELARMEWERALRLAPGHCPAHAALAREADSEKKRKTHCMAYLTCAGEAADQKERDWCRRMTP